MWRRFLRLTAVKVLTGLASTTHDQETTNESARFIQRNSSYITIVNYFFLTSDAHSWIIPIAGKMTSSCPVTNREASIGTAPAARMAWMFFGLLLQLHNAMHAFWVSWKSLSSLGEVLHRRLLSGWIMLTWNALHKNSLKWKQNAGYVSWANKYFRL